VEPGWRNGRSKEKTEKREKREKKGKNRRQKRQKRDGKGGKRVTYGRTANAGNSNWLCVWQEAKRRRPWL
jgi:hypothetical protein